jgi:nitrite reductase/ring-hydroxylating ferredoxin subunit
MAGESATDRPCQGASAPRRRDVLVKLAAGATGTWFLQAFGVAGCGTRGTAPLSASVPLDRLADGKRVIVSVGPQVVEVFGDGDTIVARSLVCPHEGCIVRWSEERRQYLCPCQGGVFDADGRPVAGPPTRPLAAVPFSARGGEVVVTPGAADGRSAQE